ncbi:hypothetical protein [Agromyces sp. SYSU T0242]|uniref:hypothetical protein n=1 Tax=Agromyces litoreus TaxID=3158561 RepID=UPI0033932D99
MDPGHDDARAAAPVEYLGVYDADGGLRGELAYVLGHVIGTAECALCDVTHRWRRKPEWDAMVRRLDAPFALRHRNEVDDASVQAEIARHGLPLVLARDDDGGWRTVLDRDQLAGARGSVDEFERLLLAVRAR